MGGAMVVLFVINRSLTVKKEGEGKLVENFV
jgi:hypothetical protein